MWIQRDAWEFYCQGHHLFNLIIRLYSVVAFVVFFCLFACVVGETKSRGGLNQSGEVVYVRASCIAVVIES